MDCISNLSENAVIAEIKNLVGKGNQLYEFVANSLNDPALTAELMNWYEQEIHSKKTRDTINKKEATEFAKRLINYYYHLNPTVKHTSILTDNEDKATLFGYFSYSDREEGKQHVANIVLQEYNDMIARNSNMFGLANLRNYYYNVVVNKWTENIFKEYISEVSTEDNLLPITIEELKSQYEVAEDKGAFIKKLVDINKDSAILKNLFAVYKELVVDPTSATSYINEIFDSRILQSVYEEIKEFDETTDVKIDNSINTMNNHMGLNSTINDLISVKLRNYFNNLDKLISTEKVGDNYQADKNNRFGLPNKMDAKSCFAVLMTRANFDNTDTMIQSIKNIAETLPGFEAFAKFADDLEKDKNLANNVFTMCARTIVSKAQLIVDDYKINVNSSNDKSDVKKSILSDFINDCKFSCLKINDDDFADEWNEISKFSYLKENKSRVGQRITAEMAKKNNDKLNDKINLLIKFAKYYMPSIQRQAVLSYIMFNNNANGDIEQQFKNYKNIVDSLSTLRNNVKDVKLEAAKQQANLSSIRSHNYKLKKDIDNGIYHSVGEFIDESVAYKDYLTQGIYQVCESFGEYLAPYSVPRIQLNSYNVEGNMSTDIINNSYITGVIKRMNKTYLDDKGNLRNNHLEKWGKRLLNNSKQYDYSNILLQRKDNRGNIINAGIFEKVGDNLVLTKNSTKLLNIFLFDGANNNNTGNAMPYDKMMSSDYLPTLFMAFKDVTDDAFDTANGSVREANYMFKIPSDASNNFGAKSLAYDTSDLIVAETEENERKLVESIKELKADEAKPYTAFPHKLQDKYTDNINPIEPETQIVDILKNQRIEIPNKETIEYDGETYEYTADQKLKSLGNNVYSVQLLIGKEAFVFKGVKKRGRGNVYLEDVKLVGVSNKNGEHTKNIINMIANENAEGSVNLKALDLILPKANTHINTNSRMFGLIKNIAKQEILDCAVALNHFFNTDEDGFVFDKSNDEDSKKVIKLKDGISNDSGYANYHKGKEGILREKDGKYYLDGKVFNSTKFTLTVEENGVVKAKNYLKELITTDFTKGDKTDGKIHLLHGKTFNDFLHVVKNEDGSVKDVVLTKEQDELLNSLLSEWVDEFAKQAQRRIESVKNFITNGEYIRNNDCHCFAFNYFVFYNNCDELLDGSSKFFKDSQTGFKRQKQGQGSGNPFGNANYESNDYDVVESDGFDKQTFTMRTKTKDGIIDTTKTISEWLKEWSLDETMSLAGLKPKSGYYGITVKNTSFTNTKTLHALSEKLVKDRIEAERSKGNKINNEAREKIKDQYDTLLFGRYEKHDDELVRSGGYQDITANDAQSYITFDEWIRRIFSKGRLNEYMPLIKKILDPTSIITPDDLRSLIQVDKNFYYDIKHDDEFNLDVPRQIKNSEFVLIPRFIKGTQLEEVYNYMKEAGIDQLNTKETSKAGIKDVLTLWDKDTNLVDKDSFVNEAKTKKEIFNYNYLYKQQDVPQHLNAKNKAGVQIMKKSTDNVDPNDSYMSSLKEDYFKILGDIIQTSAIQLMDELNIPHDANGNINIDSLQEGEFDFKNLYAKLKAELVRLGVDNNLLDYVTLDETTGMPLMQPYNNNIAGKFESIVQSVFNHAVTRQELPGFHAAQLTNIGWKKSNIAKYEYAYAKELQYHPMGYKDEDGNIISEREYKKLNADDKKKYKADKPLPYIEIMIPASNFGIDRTSSHYANMSDEEILKELNESGVNTVLGYRIPTEGKQSVALMKVVGFIDDAMGSTIVVPNDWVGQTGSDFDIDSVYGIQYELTKKADGQVVKVEYIEDKNVTEYDYFNYVTRNARVGVSEKKDYFEKRKQIFEDNEALWNKLNVERQNEWQNASPKCKDLIKRIHFETKQLISEGKLEDNITSKLQYFIEKVDKLINKNRKKIENDESVRDRFIELSDYSDKTQDLLDFITGQSQELTTRQEELLHETMSKMETLAKESGLVSYDEFKQYSGSNNIESTKNINTIQAKRNKLIDIMFKIYENSSVLEENLSRSNFDDIKYWRDLLMPEGFKIQKQNRNVYNVFDQCDNQNDAMSGAALKGISVSFDNFCSICNTVRPTLSSNINIVYDKEDYDNTKELDKNFDNTFKNNDNSKYHVIAHNKYGWSNNFRNVTGAFMTIYSSQTTAHILDAIKEGNVPNVNIFTFPVYKLFVNIGSDYKTAIGYIMQPGITRLVNNYNSINSVYSNSTLDATVETIKSYAMELGLKVTQYTPRNEVYKAINDEELLNEVKDLFYKDINVADITSFEDLPIHSTLQIDRLKETGIFKNNERAKKLFDLIVACQFKKLNEIAGATSALAQCTSTDKFGAKSTVFETNEMLDKICKGFNDDTLLVNGEPMLRSIYPLKIEENDVASTEDMYGTLDSNSLVNLILSADSNIKSTYPPLYYYLKFATAQSSLISKLVFDTQNTNFVNLVKGIGNYFTNKPTINEDQYNDFQKHVMTFIYNNVDYVRYPLVYNKDSKDHYSLNTNEDTEILERRRIFGINQSNDIAILETKTFVDAEGNEQTEMVSRPFDVKDINNPTQDEINDYMTLSPAQKVTYIKSVFKDSGIFSRLQTSTFNDRRRRSCGTQTIEFEQDIEEYNTIYHEFDEAFFNTNPLIQLAAHDLIKYAVVVEGLKVQSHGISRIISNKPLTSDFGNFGTGFQNGVQNLIKQVNQYQVFNSINGNSQIYETYIRNHDCKEIKSINVNKYTLSQLHMVGMTQGMYRVSLEAKDKLLRYGLAKRIVDDEVEVNNFIYLNTKQFNKTIKVLYKINNTPNGLLLYPMNSLRRNEIGEFSCDSNNNKFRASKYYEGMLNQYKQITDDDASFSKFANILRETEYVDEAPKYIQGEQELNLNELAKTNNDANLIINKILANPNKSFYHRSSILSDYVKIPGIKGSIQTTITDGDETKKVIITKIDSNQFYKYLKRNDKGEIENSKYDHKYYGNKLNELVQSKEIRDIIIQAQDAGLQRISNLFLINPVVEEEEMALTASIEETEINTLEYMSIESKKDDTNAAFKLAKVKTKIPNLDFSDNKANTDTMKQAITVNRADVTRQIASYLDDEVTKLVGKFKYFRQNPYEPNAYFSMTDDEIYNLMTKDKRVGDEYLQVLNKIAAIQKRFSIYNDISDVDKLDSSTRMYIKKIQDKLEELNKSCNTSVAAHNYAVAYLSKLSTNNLINDAIVAITDNYWKTYGIMWRFNDIAENGNPLLQVILKDVMGDIEAKRQKGLRAKVNFFKEIDSIIAKAKSEGHTVDLNKLIDENGTLAQDYNGDFIKEYERLEHAVKEAAREHDYGSIEHLEAKYAFEKFKADHLNQEVVPEYYVKKLHNERLILDTISELYSDYMRLRYQYINRLDELAKKGHDDSLQNEIDAIYDKMRNLYSKHLRINGEFVSRERFENDDKRSYYQAEILSNFIEAKKKLDESYYQADPVYSFEQELKRNLKIIASYEQRGADGQPTVPSNLLMQKQEYREAKSWLKNNARYELFKNKAYNELYKEPKTISEKLHNAISRLHLDRNVKTGGVNDIIRRNEITDEFGVPDARKLTKDQIKNVRTIQEKYFMTAGYPIGADTILMSNAKVERKIYKKDFYDKLKSDGFQNSDYIALVTNINQILKKYYDPITDTIRLERMAENKKLVKDENNNDIEEGLLDAKKLGELYDELRSTSKYYDSTNKDSIKEFINNECEVNTNDAAFEEQKMAVKGTSQLYQLYLSKVIFEFNRDGEPVLDEFGRPKPNRYMFGYIKPKDESKYIDEQKTKDIALLDKYYRKAKSQYYYEALAEAEQERQKSGNKDLVSQWYLDNHVYNPYTRQMQPLDVWLYSEFRYENFDEADNDGEKLDGHWVPSFSQTERKVKNGMVNGSYLSTEDKRNPNYDPKGYIYTNYVKGSQKGKYDNDRNLNDYERKLRNHIMKTLLATASTGSARRFFEKGYLPIKEKDTRSKAQIAVQEVAKFTGLDYTVHKEEADWYDNIGYDYDAQPLMPMTSRILNEKLGSVVFNDPEPSKLDKKAHDDWEKKKEEVEAKNREIHNSLLNRDWKTVLGEYLDRSAYYNAVQDNKDKLYYLQYMLRNQKAFVREHQGYGGFKIERGDIVTKVDNSLVDQYETFMRRLLFDQYNVDSGKAVTAIKMLQGLTSTSYMMANFRGGIANVTVGGMGMLSEYLAGEAFGKGDWAFATKEWFKGSGGFVLSMYDEEKSTNLQDAIVKRFKVVDYDQITGVLDESKLAETSRRIRSAMFSPQTIGEHFMQNNTLFAMLHSHKLVHIDDDPNGIGVTFMTKQEYINNRINRCIDKFLTKEQVEAFEEFKNEIKADKNKVKDYAWYRKDLLTNFIYLHTKNYKDILKQIKDKKKELSTEFDELDNMYSQLKFKDGQLAFREDSTLDKLSHEYISNVEVDDDKYDKYRDLTKADAILGKFSERVRKTNNKIHGVYNKIGKAWIEQYAIGGLIMQYHKHLPVGILKRWRSRGYYNETRGTVEKGMYTSVLDFLSLNADKVKVDMGLTDANADAIKGVQFIVKAAFEYLLNVRQTWSILPDREKANIRRNLGDLGGIIGGLLLTVLLLAGGDDDDEGRMFNLALYEADRLQAECFLYNPIGLITETKTLMSTPIAAETIIEDCLNGVKNLCKYMIADDDDDSALYYQTGRFAGENKLSVYFKRHIPVYHGIEQIINIADNNHYYKIGDTAKSIFLK